MATNEGNLVLTAEDRTAAAFASLERRIKSVSEVVARGRDLLPEGLVSGLTVAGITEFVRSSAEAVSSQRAMAESLGLTVAQFSGYNYVARQSSLTQEDLGKALFKLNVLLRDGATEGSKAAETLGRFGITSAQVRSGQVGTNEALQRIADQFAELPNGINKSALAVDLLGNKLGPRLIPFLNQGSKGLEDLATQGEAAGAVMSDKVADAVAKANDKLAAFHQTLQTEVLVGLAALFGLVESTDGDAKLESMSTGLVQLRGELARLEEQSAHANTEGWLGRLVAGGNPEKIAALKVRIEDLQKAYDKAKDAQMALLEASGKSGKNSTVSTSTALPPDDSAAKKQAAEIDRLLGQYDSQGQELKKLSADQDRLHQLVVRGKITWDEYGRAIDGVGQKYADLGATEDAEAARREKEAADLQHLIDKYDQHGAELRTLAADRATLQAQAIAGNEQAIAAVEELDKKYAELTAKQNGGTSVFADQAARNIQGLTASMFDAALSGKNMGDVIVASLRRIAAEMAAQAALNALFGAMSGSSIGWISAIGKAGTQNMGHRAMGGPVSAGGLYEVNERGTELLSMGGKDYLMMGNHSGYVTPSGQGGRNVVVNIGSTNIDARGSSAEMLPMLARLMQESDARTKRDVYEAIRRGTNP